MDPQPAASAKSVSIPAERYQQLRNEQNLVVALLAGIVAAIIGGAIWAGITVATEYQIGYMAIAVGFIVGFAVRLGRGIDKIYGVIGAILALLGCVLGNILTIIIVLSKQEHLGLLETALHIDYSLIPKVLQETFSVMDLVFYGIAIYEGYRFSFRRITPEDLGIAPAPASSIQPPPAGPQP